MFRRPNDADIDAVARIVAAEAEELRGETTWGTTETRDWWRVVDAEASWIAEDAGAVLAFAAMHRRGPRWICWAAVDPKHTGRGLGTELLTRCEQHARATDAESLDGGMFAENDAARELFERLGFREARRYYRMQIDFHDPPDQPEWPEGITIGTFQPDAARDFHAALDEAFADDWGHVSIPFEEWKEFRLAPPDVDTSLWFVARDGDEIAGVARCDPKHHGGGWVGALAVRKRWRRRGLGLALLRHALVEFHRRGEPHVGLGVDAENESGATHLYERAGMRVMTEDVVFQKELA